MSGPFVANDDGIDVDFTASSGVTRFLHVVWGEKTVSPRLCGGTLRSFYERLGELHLRADGLLDMRYATSRRIQSEEKAASGS